MKKVTIIALVLVASSFAACKKQRVCTCTYSNSGSSNTYTQVSTFDKVSKKTANANCTSGTVYSQASPGDIQTRVCDLK